MPTYETKTDREKERRLVHLLSAKWKVFPMEFPEFARADYTLIKEGQGVALLEAKVRTIPMGEYQTTIIPEQKVQDLKTGCELFGLKPIFVCQWSDKTGWVNLNEATGSVRDVERHDRPGVSAPHLFIPISQFTEVRWEA